MQAEVMVRIDFKTNAATGGTAGRGGFKFIDGDGNNILYLENNDSSATFAGSATIRKSALGGSTAMSDGTLILGAGVTDYFSFRLDSGADLYLDKVYASTAANVFSIDRSTTNGDITFAGDVGIGGAPAYALDISGGSAWIDSDWPFYFGSTNAFIEGNSSGTIVRINASAGFKVTDGGTTRFDIDTDGDATFAGEVAMRNDQGASNNAILRLRGQNTTNRITRLQLEDYSGALADGLIQFRVPTAGTASSAVLELGVNSAGLTLAHGHDATFAGSIGTTGDMVLKSDNVAALTLWDSGGAGLGKFHNNLTIIGKATSAATITGDGNTTLTTKGYVDGLIVGATIYQGTWDANNGAGGTPDLTTSTYKTNGYYFVVSVAGDATPNDPGTTPDDWHVGDWVIYNDHTGSSAWQKIDNSSILSGVGQGQTVALWQGTNAVTDSETLGNAPITFSTNDATFAGDVAISNATPALTLTDTDNSSNIVFSSVGGALIVNSASDQVYQIGSTEYFRIATTGATFAGTVTSGAATAFNISSTSGKLSFANDPTNYYIHHKDSTDGIVVSGYYGASLAHRGNVKLSVGSGGIEVTGTLAAGATTLTSTTNLLLTLNPTAGNYGGILFQYGGATKGLSYYNSGLMIFGGEAGVPTRLQAGGGYGLHIDATNQNVHVGSTSDTSYKLAVNGTVYGSSTATFGGSVISGNDFVLPSLGTTGSPNNAYLMCDNDAAGGGKLFIQAGEGSAGYGGGLVLYGHAHATKPGWVTAGISSGSGGKFSVNTQGQGGGTDVFTVDTSGDATFAGDIQAPGIYVGSTNTSYDFYNNGTSYFNGAVTVDDTLAVAGNVTIEQDVSTVYDATTNQTGGLFVNNIYHEAVDTFSQLRLGVSGASGASSARIVAIEPSQAASDLAFCLRDGSGYNEVLRLKGPTQNVGIGTDSPSTRLEVSSSLTSGIKVTNSGTINGEAGIEAYHTGAQTGTAYAGYITKTGAGGTNVGIYTAASGATDNYGLIVGFWQRRNRDDNPVKCINSFRRNKSAWG